MIVFPNCKINLGLNILRKRPDGYHDLETIFYPVGITDSLEIIENRTTKFPTFPFTSSGLTIEGSISSNLCVKAYKLLKKKYPSLPSMQIHLHKVIPSGAGLGGGSADAAFTLQLINDMMKFGMSKEELIACAAELGSDCPFFIINKPCYATGRGEILEEISMDLSAYKFVIVHPGIHIDTGVAFRGIQVGDTGRSVKEIVQLPIGRWKDELKNDFEKPIFREHWDIVDIKDELYRRGALYASMSGSGSTVYGIFEKDQEVSLQFKPGYFVRELPC